jgi:Fe2+ or Zn2+ uptake regulation protein
MPIRTLDPHSVREALETSGLRCTPQRLAVYDFLSRADHHPTAEEVYQGVRTAVPRISLATVYKALEALVSTGVASKLSGGVGGEISARYDARLDRHYHFYCERTGKVHDLPTEFDGELIEKLDPKLADYLECHGFRVTGYHLVLLGHQDVCVSAPPRAAAGLDSSIVAGPAPVNLLETSGKLSGS